MEYNKMITVYGSYEPAVTIRGNLAIPHSSGWSARLDGETISCMPVDNFGMAIYIPAGGHIV